MELGIYTFGDITPDPNTGRAISTAQRYAEILATAKLADESGLHVFGVGEHHRLDLPISSPAVVMAAIAGGTKPHPPEQRSHNPLDPRSCPGLSGLRDRGSPLPRPS